jgi:hypothetical protein
MASPIMRYFKYTHLPLPLQETSKLFADLALEIDSMLLVDETEKQAGLRRLLEAKDCIVRARLAAL